MQQHVKLISDRKEEKKITCRKFRLQLLAWFIGSGYHFLQKTVPYGRSVAMVFLMLRKYLAFCRPRQFARGGLLATAPSSCRTRLVPSPAAVFSPISRGTKLLVLV